MRMRYCQILQKVDTGAMDSEWLPPLEDVTSLGVSSHVLRPTRRQLFHHYLHSIRLLFTPPQQKESSDVLLTLEAERPHGKGDVVRSFLRLPRQKKDMVDKVDVKDDDEKIEKWLDVLVQWMDDSQEAVSTEAMMALYHTTSRASALAYLSATSLQPLLCLCERTTQFKSLKQRQIISLLAERISLVPAPDDSVNSYCFDREKKEEQLVVKVVGDDTVPVRELLTRSDAVRWRKCIVYWCFQKDEVQRKAGVKTLCNYIQRSSQGTEMMKVWTESLLSILQPQSNPSLAEEARGYLIRAGTKQNGRDWWPVRCYLRALSLYASDEEMGDIMLDSGMLPVLQVFADSDIESIDVQICRILSSMTATQTPAGLLTRQFVNKHWHKTLSQWAKSDLTKLRFYSEKVLYNCSSGPSDEVLGDSVFVLFADPVVRHLAKKEKRKEKEKEKDEKKKEKEEEPMVKKENNNKTEVSDDWDADIVFIHGLRGCFFKTWRLPCENDNFDHCVCWPESFLPPSLHASIRHLSLRVLSIDYPAAMKPSATPQPALSYQQYAHFIRGELMRAGVGQRPVVFVTHSMGGLILKQILLEEYQDDFSSPLLFNTKGIVFYSTPHKGSPIVKWNKTTMEKVLRFAPVVSQLKASSPELQMLNQAFLEIRPLPAIVSISESEPIHVSKGVDLLVVPPEYAQIDVGDFVVLSGKDHMSVCKPNDINDPSYTLAESFIQRVLQGVVKKSLVDFSGTGERNEKK